jgi:integrase
MRTKREKPAKPYAGFPLFPHASGQWAKTILGEHHYFGKWDNLQAALEKYNAHKDYLYARQSPPSDHITLADVLNEFRNRKRQAVADGELTERSFEEYESVCDTIATIGKQLPVEVVNLAKVRTKICKGKNGKRLSPTSQKRLLGIARMVFNFANEEMEPPLAKPIRYRKALKLPPAKIIRQSRNEVGERLFSAEEIRGLLAIAKPQMKAMIYLGINCGFGNRDCATLPVERVDVSGGWHYYWRPKTQIARRCPLWPETAAALYAIIKERKSGLVFITKYGNPWEGKGRADPISYEFRKLVHELKIHRKGVTTFYSLRRTFETIGATTGEQLAVDYIMGHTPPADDMAAVYRQKTFNTPLLKVTDHVRGWLNGSISVT